MIARLRSRALAFPIAVAIASRVFSVALLLVVPRLRPASLPLLTVYKSPFVAWDGQWYLSIVAHGYHAAPIQVTSIAARHDFAFYPGWPAFVWLADQLGLPAHVAAVVLANALFVAALAVIYLVLVDRLGGDAARRGVVLLAFAPSAYVLSMAYSEPLFLLVAGLYFLRPARPGRPIAAAATILVRVAGLALLASAAVVWIRDRRDRSTLSAGLAVLVAFAAWWSWIWWLTGDPVGWLNGSLDWGHIGGIPGIIQAIQQPTLFRLGALAFTALMLVGAVLVLRVDVELGVYAVAAVALGALGGWVSSMPRYSLVAFPAFAVLGTRLGRRGWIALAIAFALGQVVSVFYAFDGRPPIAP